MEIKIKIEDYLNSEEIKEECKSAIHSIIVKQYDSEQQINRLISNLSYDILFKQISDVIGKNAVALVKDIVAELIMDKSSISYLLFRRKDVFENEEGVGYKILTQAIRDNENLIKERVREAINKYDFGDTREICDRIQDLFNEIIEERLFNIKK